MEENLVEGVQTAHFESDLSEGDGGELRKKFPAIHSSAALAVNAFAPFKERPQDVQLLGENGALSIRLEKQMPIVPGCRASTLDVWIDRESTAVAVEVSPSIEDYRRSNARTHQDLSISIDTYRGQRFLAL